MLCPSHYNGPSLVAQVVERYFGDRKDDTYIIDVGAGTGFVGEEVSWGQLIVLAFVCTLKRITTKIA